jgi:two-component system, OmpR family, alkaline phosphatase synthesis response regulator PhoP
MSDKPLILCADDDPDILALLALRLEGAGFRVAQAVDGEQALTLTRELQPSVVVLDVMMPRLMGIEVVEAIRADPATHDLRVILVSARAQQSDVEVGLTAGADAYLAKPFQASELIELVQSLLGPR